ncbi:hypothetical protein STEG23_031467 [Scotinomys teguina]
MWNLGLLSSVSIGTECVLHGELNSTEDNYNHKHMWVISTFAQSLVPFPKYFGSVGNVPKNHHPCDYDHHGDENTGWLSWLHSMCRSQKMKTCGLLPGWYGLTSQDLLTALQMFQNPDQLQDNWLKDEASQTAPVKIEQSP